MNIAEEHARVRGFLQRLGSAHAYREPLLSGDFGHQPVRIQARPAVNILTDKAASAPVSAPVPAPGNRPDALAFALRGPAGAPEPAVPAAPVPAPPTATAEAAGRAPAIAPVRKYRRIFSYYGSKSKIAHLYPAPRHDVVIEPFAGSAAYSALHYERQIHINEKDDVTASAWRFLLRPDAMECVERWFPKEVVEGAFINDLFPMDVDVGFVNLIRAEGGQGSFGLENRRAVISPWAARDWHQVRDRIEYWIPLIQHWMLTTLDYSEIPNREATWFIDPPYDNAAGSIYRTGGLNYRKLAKWCMEREGQVMVCENEGASWLPFRFLTKRMGSFTGRDDIAKASGGEVIWEKSIDPVIDVPEETSALSFALGTADAAFDAEGVRSMLAAKGHILLTRDGRLFCSNASKLSDGDRALIKANKPALLAVALPWRDEQEPEPAPSVSATSLFGSTAQVPTLAQFLGNAPSESIDWTPDEPPSLDGIDEVVLNFATSGLKWAAGDLPVGVTVGTLDGGLTRFLPFAFRAGGNLDEAAVRRWAERELRGKKIYNSNTRFDLHMSRAWGVDLTEQDNAFTDIQHTAALLDDHRRRFGLDVLAADYLPGAPLVERVDETRHAEYHASEVARRERHTVHLVAMLRDAMYPELARQELERVQALEDDVIPVVVEMEKNGSPLDLQLLEEYHSECLRRHDALLRELSDEVGFAFDHKPSSWTRLFEKLGLPPSDSYAEKVIKQIDHPTVRKAYLASQYASLDSKTFKAYREMVGPDGVLRFDINQLRGDDGGTVSGRFSIGYVQQVPNPDNHFAVFGEELFPRRLFIPDRRGCPDAGYLDADAMQIEQRLLVHYANNEKIIREYDGDLERLMRGEDTVSYHKVTWNMIKEYKPDMLYSHQKNFNFAFQYGAKSIKLAVMMGFITEADGNEIRAAKRWNDPRLALIHEIEAAYDRMFPESAALLERAAHLAKPECDEYCRRGDRLHREYPHRGWVRTLLGRRSRFPTNYKAYIGLNRVLQGTGADILKRKTVELHRERKRTGFVLRLTVHDAVGGDARTPETKRQVSEILNAQSFPDLKVPILWSVKTGRNWAECR